MPALSRLAADKRIDPRIRRMFGHRPMTTLSDVGSRAELLTTVDQYASLMSLFEEFDYEVLVRSKGFEVNSHTLKSKPDGNEINIQIVRGIGGRNLPCVYYIHGGGMQWGSYREPHYQAWAKLIASQGVAVALIDFRNAILPSSVPEVAPFPAGLQDCRSGAEWLYEHAADFSLNRDQIIVAGESGGGNLAIATAMALAQDGKGDLFKGLYALCPFISGEWPRPELTSSVEYNLIWGDMHNNRARMGYGIEAFEARNPLAWPLFASAKDVEKLPPTVISLNECDALRDEGLEFYRLLINAGVEARCRQVMGTTHAIELFPSCCPEISLDTALDIARFACS
jgi:acetyl esterase